MARIAVTSDAVQKTNRNLMKVIDRLMEESAHIKRMDPPTRDSKGREIYADLLYLSERLDKCNVRLMGCKKDLDALYQKVKNYEEA